MYVKEILSTTAQKGASDLHLCSGMAPFIRLAGLISPLNDSPLSGEEIIRMLKEVLPPGKAIEEGKDIDAGVQVEGVGRFRLNVYFDLNGICAAFRLIPNTIRSPEKLGLPKSVLKIQLMKRGLVLVTGITGSGKSTTLASIINIINEKRREHIITIEDPIEFVHHNKKCIINQREVGAHVSSFAGALNSALREDPDVILVGELRDLDTIAMAITAAETGHLVLATLHTKDAPQTVGRIIDVFPPYQQEQIRIQLADTLKVIISQVLIPSSVSEEVFLACEVMVVTPAIRQLIREKKTFQIKSEIQTGGERFGMQTLEDSIKVLANSGKINLSDVYHWIYDEGVFEKG